MKYQILFTTLSLIIIGNLYGQEQISHKQDFPNFIKPEVSPIPKHLSFNAIQESILNKIEYPEDFKKEGLVVIQFMVNLDGKVTTPKIRKGLDPRIDQQILDLICDFEFTPGKFYEKEIPMFVNFPIRIALTE